MAGRIVVSNRTTVDDSPRSFARFTFARKIISRLYETFQFRLINVQHARLECNTRNELS